MNSKLIKDLHGSFQENVCYENYKIFFNRSKTFFLKLFIWLKQKVGQKSIKSIKHTPDYLLQTLQIYRLLEIIFQTITSGRCIGDQAGVASAVHDWRHQLETVRTTQTALFIRP